MSAAAAAASDPQNRTESGKFAPGNRANPGGRPKGLAAKVRELAPPEKLTEFYLQVFAGTLDGMKITMRDRIEAANWLADRGYGKAASFVPVEDGDPLELNDVQRAIGSFMDELAAKRATQVPRGAADGVVAGEREAGAA